MDLLSSKPSKSAFTLVELLVVIAIIALLAAILFPTFARARENARRAACQSNMKQIALGFAQYSQDYDERLPLAWANGTGENQAGGWTYYSVFDANGKTSSFDLSRGSLYPYLKNAQIFRCPSDVNNDGGPQSYAINACLLNENSSDADSGWGKSMAEFAETPRWILMGEEAVSGNSTDDGVLFDVSSLSVRHLEGSNLAFMDGHVKWYRPAAVVSNNFQTGGETGGSCWSGGGGGGGGFFGGPPAVCGQDADGDGEPNRSDPDWVAPPGVVCPV